MKRFARALFALLAFVVTVPTAAAQGTPDGWSDLEVRGTPAAFARAAGLDERLDPQRIVLEWIRVRDLPAVTGEMRLKRVQMYLATLEKYRTLHVRIGPDVSLTLA